MRLLFLLCKTGRSRAKLPHKKARLNRAKPRANGGRTVWSLTLNNRRKWDAGDNAIRKRVRCYQLPCSLRFPSRIRSLLLPGIPLAT